jgi:hypothetical protein
VATPRLFNKAAKAGVFEHKVFGMPVDKETIFSNYKGIQKPRIAKRQRKLVTKLSFLRPFLESGECILLVTTGHAPSTVLDKYGVGWIFKYLKRSLIIFTDRRIFHVPTDPKYQYRGIIAQVPYASCESLQIKGRSLLVEYKGGNTSEKFISLSGRERKKIRELIKMIAFADAQSQIPRRTHLCPKCAGRLFSLTPKCRQCGLEFKKSVVAKWFAILLPGGGYFYLRQPLLGAAFAILEVSAIALIAGYANNLVNGVPDLMSNLLWLGLGILMLGVLKPIAVVHAQILAGEFVPAESDVTFQAAAS